MSRTGVRGRTDSENRSGGETLAPRRVGRWRHLVTQLTMKTGVEDRRSLRGRWVAPPGDTANNENRSGRETLAPRRAGAWRHLVTQPTMRTRMDDGSSYL